MKLSTIMKQDLGYNPTAKKQFHTAARRCLNKLAKELSLEKGEFDLRSNQGGIAVSGEVTLHTDWCYVQVSQPFGFRGTEVMYRLCEGRKDYCGKTNNFTSPEVLEERPDMLAKLLLRMQERAGMSPGESYAETMWR